MTVSGRQTPKTTKKRAMGTVEAPGGIEELNDPGVLGQYRGKTKRQKYGAKKVTIDGIRFDSQAEGRRYQQLKLLQQSGQISKLELQPKFVLQTGFKDQWSGRRERAITYRADFRYIEAGHPVVEDVKGRETQVFRVKWKIVKAQHPGTEFRIVKMH